MNRNVNFNQARSAENARGAPKATPCDRAALQMLVCQRENITNSSVSFPLSTDRYAYLLNYMTISGLGAHESVCGIKINLLSRI